MKAILTHFLLCGLLLGGTTLMAQRTHSFSAGFGTAYYYGDLTDKFNNSLVKPAFSISYSKYFMPLLRFRLAASYGEVGAADAQAIDNGRTVRNLHFRSHIAEFSGQLVFELRSDKNFGNTWVKKPHITPYAFVGAGFFHMDPQARHFDEWVSLQPLGTEGQYIDGGPGGYSLIQFAAPIGGGISIRLSDYTGISFEIGYRFTGTDFIDDVSGVYPDFEALNQASGPVAVALSERSANGMFQPGMVRGNPGVRDSYFFTMFTLNYYLNRYASRD